MLKRSAEKPGLLNFQSLVNLPLQSVPLLILVLTYFQPSFAQKNPPKKILFVGNSYTYFWNLPQQVSALALSTGDTLITRQSTIGGSNLGQHWRGDRGLQSTNLIQSKKFDVVVLQDHSRRSIDAPDSLLYFGSLLGNQIKESGAEIYVYETWAREWDPLMMPSIRKGYRRLADETSATLIPAGTAWAHAKKLRPDLKLYDKDGSHPSAVGTYLTACVFYSVITGKRAEGLPNRLVTKDKDGEKLYLNIVPPNDALFCQKVVDTILSIHSNE